MPLTVTETHFKICRDEEFCLSDLEVFDTDDEDKALVWLENRLFCGEELEKSGERESEWDEGG